jgi:hypothetical protein
LAGAKSQGSDQDCMDDFRSALLAAYFPLEDGYMIKRNMSGTTGRTVLSRIEDIDKMFLPLVLACFENYVNALLRPPVIQPTKPFFGIARVWWFVWMSGQMDFNFSRWMLLLVVGPSDCR